MQACTSFISDVHKSYRVEKIVLHHLIFVLIKISKCLLVPNAILFHMLLPYKSLILAVVINLRLEPINLVKYKYQVMQNYFFYTIRLVDIGRKLVYAGILTSNFFVIQIIVKSRHHIDL